MNEPNIMNREPLNAFFTFYFLFSHNYCQAAHARAVRLLWLSYIWAGDNDQTDPRSIAPHWSQKVKAQRTTAANSLSVTRVSALHALCQNLPPKKTSNATPQASSENLNFFFSFFFFVVVVFSLSKCVEPRSAPSSVS